MDKDYIKTVVSEEYGKDDRLIKEGELIDREMITLLCSVKQANRAKAFYLYPEKTRKNRKTYSVETICPNCGKIIVREYTKTQTLDLMRDAIGDIKLYCDKCKAEKEEQDKIEKENSHKEWVTKRELETQRYIADYLNPNNSFKKEIKAKEKIYSIMQSTSSCWYGLDRLNFDEVTEKIVSMNYYDFLKTPYWDGVRNYKLKKENYTCQLCGKRYVPLNVHHKTYERHGMEHYDYVADEDLIVLCKECHSKFHDKLPNSDE